MQPLPAPLPIPEHSPLSYDYPVDRLRLGSSLGNRLLFVRTDQESNLLGLWASEDQWYCGSLRIQARVGDRRLLPVRTRFYPDGQATDCEADPLRMRKWIWVPFGTAWDRCVFWFVDLANGGGAEACVSLRVDVVWPPIVEEEGLKRAEPQQQEKRVLSRYRGGFVVALTLSPGGDPSPEARLVGIWPGDREPARCQFGQPGRVRLVYEVALAAGELRRLPLVLATSPEGEEAVQRLWAGMPAPEELYRQTVEHLRALLGRPVLLTPSAVVNRGFEWAKVNTLRPQSCYPAGSGFTNDPPQDVLVVRDAAWYIFGNDFFIPDFSREMMDLILREGVEPTGMLTEYIRCAEQPPSRENYGLNINDDTPLFLLAVYHHVAATCDRAFARVAYPVVRRAADYILSQMRGDLVVCGSRETNVRGIAGWRNIIPGFNLSGAVTEINAECWAALRRSAELAGWLGHPEEARRWEQAADRLRAAIHRDLVSPVTGLYLLARSLEGEPVEAVTADMVFPLLFGVAQEDARRRVEALLLSPAVWTPHGARTVGEDQPEYDPDVGFQLLGGVWPNLTAWIAFALRESRPDLVAEALAVIYRVSESDVPASFGHVVPGEFPERVHGETGVSRGMALSPWVAPTYLWLAVSGLVGVEVSLEGLKCRPCVPAAWPWVLLRDLPYAGGRVSVAVWKGEVHLSLPGELGEPAAAVASLHRYEADSTADLELTAPGGPWPGGAAGPPEAPVRRLPDGRWEVLALRRGGSATVFVAREAPGRPQASEPVALRLRWRPAGGREVWAGLLGPGEAVRLRLRWETGELLEEERAGPLQAAEAVPRPAA